MDISQLGTDMATRPNGLSLIFGTNMVEGEN